MATNMEEQVSPTIRKMRLRRFLGIDWVFEFWGVLFGKSPLKSEDRWLGHFIGFLFFVVVPGTITTMAPVSWLKLERAGGNVSATATTCMFFMIPYTHQSVTSVTSIDYKNYQGWRRHWFVFDIRNAEGEHLYLPVSWLLIESVSGRARDFLANSTVPELRIIVFANLTGVVVGGLGSILTLTYVLGMVLLAVRSAKWRLEPKVAQS